MLLLTNCKDKESNLYSKDICSEKVAPFYFKNYEEENKEELMLLCKCLWNKFPEGSWQRKINIKLYNGEDIGWKIKSFSSFFEVNYDNCKNELNINE